MAEVAVTAALVLVEIISPYIDTKKYAEKIDIRSMRSWLSSMKAFIEDNYGVEGRRMMEDQMAKVRDTAYNIEDVLEELLIHSPPYTFHDHRLSKKIHKFAHKVHHRFPLRGISDKIDRITKDIEDIKAQTLALGVRDSISQAQPSSSSSSYNSQPAAVSPLLPDGEMVGYEKHKSELMKQLVDREKKLLTVAVEGPPGSGKTTLVKNVFWKQGIRGKFDCHAWVKVSRHSNVEELLVNMLRQLCFSRKDSYPLDDGSSTSAKLQTYLSRRRYIVALDDVCKQEDWNHIKNALPDASRGSRIIVTTSSSDLASICASLNFRHLFRLTNGLAWPDGWRLFCRKAFSDNGECPVDLKDSAIRIAKRCEGNPQAIVAVGGALKNKPRLPSEWDRFHENLGDEMIRGLAVLTRGLQLSYMDLSTNLKCCFLYFSIFPEDYSVECGRLVRLWVAERFALGTDYKTAEEVAEDYLMELIQRNLVHVSKWDFDGRPRNCRVLNITLKFIIQKCKDENFASIFPPGKMDLSQKIRRLSVHDDFSHLPENCDLSGVRSMLLLRLMNKSGPQDFEKYLSKLKLVRVLDFEGAPLTEFPNDITRLTLVKYLSFRDTKIKTIPSSIKKLSFLETLDLEQTGVTQLPPEISALHCLCHLFVSFGVKVHQGFDSLKNLQDLSLVRVGQKGVLLREIRKLTRLRKLGLTGLKREHTKDLCAAVESMANLTTLDLTTAAGSEEFLDLEEVKNPPKTLQRLLLKGRLKRFPSWISSLHNLLTAVLKSSKMEYSPLQALERLPNLMELHLVDCFVGKELIFEASFFKKLKMLLIEDFMELRMIVIGDESMAELKEISLRSCHQLEMFLLGSNALIKVEEMSLYDMAEEFVARLRMEGEDRALVNHIPVIHSFTRRNKNWSFQNLSPSSTN